MCYDLGLLGCRGKSGFNLLAGNSAIGYARGRLGLNVRPVYRGKIGRSWRVLCVSTRLQVLTIVGKMSVCGLICVIVGGSYHSCGEFYRSSQFTCFWALAGCIFVVLNLVNYSLLK